MNQFSFICTGTTGCDGLFGRLLLGLLLLPLLFGLPVLAVIHINRAVQDKRLANSSKLYIKDLSVGLFCLAVFIASLVVAHKNGILSMLFDVGY